MGEQTTPHLFNSGLKLDFEKLKHDDFSGVLHLEENKVFTNGMMRELVICLGDYLDNDKFFELIKNLVPLSIVNNELFPKDRQSFVGTKLKPFIAEVKKVQKTKAKLVVYLKQNFPFLIQPKGSPRKRLLKKKISEVEAENKELKSSNQAAASTIELLEGEMEKKDDEIESMQGKINKIAK